MIFVPLPPAARHFLPCLILVSFFTGNIIAERVRPVSVADPVLPASTWANGDSLVADASADGRYVVFVSSAANLTEDRVSLGVLNVYLRDRADGSVILVSRSPEGRGGDGHSAEARITPDGGHVVYQSAAGNLTPNDINHADDIFLWDARTRSNHLVSYSFAGARTGDGASSAPVVTPDGRYVGFVSSASDLISDDTNAIPDVFVRDMQEQVTRQVSVGATAIAHGLSGARSPVITADGRFIAFEALANGLAPGVASATSQVYLRDLVHNQTFWISRDVGQFLGEAVVRSYNPVLSDDGRYVVFKTAPGGTGIPSSTLFRHDVAEGSTEVLATDLLGHDISVEDDSGPVMTPDGRFIAYTRQPRGSFASDVYIWDADSGTTELVSVNLHGAGGANANSDTPRVSSDGRQVAFLSSATDLVELSMTAATRLYLRDRQLGETTLLSVDATGFAPGRQDVVFPVLTSTADFAAFDVFDDGLQAGDWNDVMDVYGWDGSGLSLLSGAPTERKGITGRGRSWSGSRSMSIDGRYVAFVSEAEDLVPNDLNAVPDIFVRDIENDTTVLVSSNMAGDGGGNSTSVSPSISADGSKIAFASYASDLAPSDNNMREDVFVRDWQTGITVLASIGLTGESTTPRGQTQPLLSPDGRYVAFSSASTELVEGPLQHTFNLYVRDLQMGATTVLTRNLPGTALSSPLFSALFFPSAASTVLFQGRSSFHQFLYWADLVDGTVARVDVPLTGAGMDKWYSFSSNATASAEGQKIAFVSTNPDLVAGDMNEKQDVFLRDLSLGMTQLISTNTNGVSGSGNSLEAMISTDGRWIVFTSAANDLVPGDMPRHPGTGEVDRDVFLRDLSAGTTRLISRSCRVEGSANGPSDSPSISGDGRFVLFRGNASDLVPNDFNSSADVFLYERESDLITALSVSLEGSWTANDHAVAPTLSTDGSAILFYSRASDLVEGDYNATTDVFWTRTESATGLPSLVADIEVAPGNQLRIGWRAVPGVQYGVQYHEALAVSDWNELPGEVTVEGTRGSMVDPHPAIRNTRYYRVFIQQ